MPLLVADDLRRITDDDLTRQIAAQRTAGMTDRQILTALMRHAIAAAEDAAFWMNNVLTDGATADPRRAPAELLDDTERDLRVLAAMTAATNAATYATQVRLLMPQVERTPGWDPLHMAEFTIPPAPGAQVRIGPHRSQPTETPEGDGPRST
jgi:hypothetical protein